MHPRTALWLAPDPALRERLAGIIDDLARLWRTPRFEPHVTLLAGLRLEAAEIREHAEALARGLQPLDVTFTRVTCRPEYHRAVFVEVEGGDLHSAHAGAAAALAAAPDPDYLPHLSLLYGNLSPEAKDAILKRVGPRWDVPGRLERLEVVRTEGAPASWIRLAAFPLGDPS
jgi:2'-5' RNA ligase